MQAADRRPGEAATAVWRVYNARSILGRALPVPARLAELPPVVEIAHVIQVPTLLSGFAGAAVHHGMIARLAGHHVDLAFLPINGRDAARHALGTPGNCTIEEALAVSTLSGIGTIVPNHYDRFAFNTADVSLFGAWADEAYPQQDYRILNCGEMATFVPREMEQARLARPFGGPLLRNA